MSKKFDVCVPVASVYLTLNAKVKRKNWVYGLQDNRLGRYLKGIGIIPFKKINGQIFYCQKDLEQVANEIMLHQLFGKPLVKLF